LFSISPAAGTPGQVVTLTGKGFFSHNGLIAVTFGSAQAPVRCPSETVCRVTVPARPAKTSSRSVVVTLKTESGTSNRVTFSYRGAAAA
jgi:IPT/TIG domain